MQCPADTPLTNAIKAALRDHYRGKCQYCGADGATHIDHIIARANGGPDTLGNATLACYRCNGRKCALPLDDMFVAIAHARAQAIAPKIAQVAEKKRASTQRTPTKPKAPTEPKAPTKPKAAPWWKTCGAPLLPGCGPRFSAMIYRDHGPEYVQALIEIREAQRIAGPHPTWLKSYRREELRKLKRLAHWGGHPPAWTLTVGKHFRPADPPPGRSRPSGAGAHSETAEHRGPAARSAAPGAR